MKTKTKKQLLKEKAKIEAQIKKIEKSEFDYIEVPELGIKITKPILPNKSYKEIAEIYGEEKIATYEILQKLRNISFNSKWKKYSFMKDLWVWCQNPDEYAKSQDYVGRFYADPGGSYLDCCRNPLDVDSDLRVILYCSITKGRKL